MLNFGLFSTGREKKEIGLIYVYMFGCLRWTVEIFLFVSLYKNAFRQKVVVRVYEFVEWTVYDYYEQQY